MLKSGGCSVHIFPMSYSDPESYAWLFFRLSFFSLGKKWNLMAGDTSFNDDVLEEGGTPPHPPHARWAPWPRDRSLLMDPQYKDESLASLGAATLSDEKREPRDV